MTRKNAFSLAIAVVLLFAFSTAVFAEDGGKPAGQTGTDMPTATMIAVYSEPEATLAPGAPSGMNMTPGTSSMTGCPMMNGMGAMGGMNQMGNMAGMSGTDSMPGMNGMGQMGSMAGMSGMGQMTGGMINEMNMAGTTSYPFVWNNPLTWIRNPWTLLGWVLLILVGLAVLAGMVAGVAWIIRRAKTTPTGQINQ